jgi:hypothetical protein
MPENVKLLTFVSIFFLSLAFCTSIWSMNDDLFPIHVLIPVIVDSSSLGLVYEAEFFELFE